MKFFRYIILLASILLAGGRDVIVDYFSQHDVASITLEIESQEKAESEAEEKADENFNHEQFSPALLLPVQDLSNRHIRYCASFQSVFDIPPEV